ncbi:MAG: hypothetical protein OXN84_20195, partial [Albidovulum sp.]|nr:hypothetical protein [Albidovulum sp.]
SDPYRCKNVPLAIFQSPIGGTLDDRRHDGIENAGLFKRLVFGNRGLASSVILKFLRNIGLLNTFPRMQRHTSILGGSRRAVRKKN